MADESDRELIKQVLQGNKAALNKLIRRYEDRLFNTVFRLLGNKEDAQDVVQETFITAYQSLRTFKGDCQFFTWLYRLAFDTAVKFKRRKGGLPPGNLPSLLPPGNVPSLSAHEDPRLQEAMNRLPPEFRYVLVLKEIEGLTFSQIAEILGVPIGTVRSRLHQARLELRVLLNQTQAGEDQQADLPFVVEPGKQTDSQLIAESLHCNEEAFRQLLSRYNDALAGIIAELVADPKVRKTLREQTVIAVRKALATFRADKPFCTWLFQIAKQTVDESKGNPPAQ